MQKVNLFEKLRKIVVINTILVQWPSCCVSLGFFVGSKYYENKYTNNLPSKLKLLLILWNIILFKRTEITLLELFIINTIALLSNKIKVGATNQSPAIGIKNNESIHLLTSFS